WVLTLIVLGSILFLTFASVALRASLRPGSDASLMGHASSEVGSAALGHIGSRRWREAAASLFAATVGGVGGEREGE
ncbi:hypothetical protein HaLaN_26006, partial [Haematococcus lacustris]